jgi:hypothetical protein
MPVLVEGKVAFITGARVDKAAAAAAESVPAHWRGDKRVSEKHEMVLIRSLDSGTDEWSARPVGAGCCRDGRLTTKSWCSILATRALPTSAARAVCV